MGTGRPGVGGAGGSFKWGGTHRLHGEGDFEKRLGGGEAVSCRCLGEEPSRRREQQCEGGSVAGTSQDRKEVSVAGGQQGKGRKAGWEGSER